MASASCLRRSSARCVILTSVSIPTRPRPRRLRHMRQSARGFRQKARQYNRYHEGVLLLWGEGPFTAELFGEEAEALRQAGGEYGAATGRPRRVGPFDAVASRYGVRVQGADCLALTKLDILSALKEIRVCTAYDVGGTITEHFPTGHALGLQSRSLRRFRAGTVTSAATVRRRICPKRRLTISNISKNWSAAQSNMYRSAPNGRHISRWTDTPGVSRCTACKGVVKLVNIVANDMHFKDLNEQIRTAKAIPSQSRAVSDSATSATACPAKQSPSTVRPATRSALT